MILKSCDIKFENDEKKIFLKLMPMIINETLLKEKGNCECGILKYVLSQKLIKSCAKKYEDNARKKIGNEHLKVSTDDDIINEILFFYSIFSN